MIKDTMKRTVGIVGIAAGIGLAGIGLGTAVASADPGQQCGAPGAPQCNSGPQNPGQQQPGQQQDQPQQRPVEQRGINDGRTDHQPFMYNGQQVNPVFDTGHNAWGFWFLGMWIPL